MARPLRQAACRSECSWSPSGRVRDGELVFECAGCHSEWVRSEPWTPCDADGTVPVAVMAERARG